MSFAQVRKAQHEAEEKGVLVCIFAASLQKTGLLEKTSSAMFGSSFAAVSSSRIFGAA